MSLVMDPPKAEGEVANLCKHLAGKKPMPIGMLPKNLNDPRVLAKAAAQGFIEFGRQSHSQSIVPDSVKLRRETGEDGKPRFVYDEQRRQVVDREYRYHMERDWSWTDLRGPGRKPLPDLLEEEASITSDDMPRLHIRLTTAGLAAA